VVFLETEGSVSRQSSVALLHAVTAFNEITGGNLGRTSSQIVVGKK
jgi:hypothetical protein